ncbi:phosphotransferase family protein [Ornithinicoccus hortensis]|uniref:Aminoglycoside phosphotransferase (APT) family kinase protein n=1 Tax=Ornithinicoccus hortensis TaxID=82346 RepID=A0A542YP55_9MICO|nr:phosphotransferase [Ornithinicoccus hortensis]TQL49882.1 aminoglycoside phosphotransferase (APT) family kinase protein [Ornithinicoccus hortensis]
MGEVRAWGRTDVTALARAHPEWFATGDPRDDNALDGDLHVTVTLLGSGESYAAWLAVALAGDELHRRGRRTAVIRVPRRSPDDLPRPMAEEFAALLLAPEGVGPRPIHLQEPGGGETGPPAYLVVDQVPGQVRPRGSWTDELLVAHAGQLARLHTRQYAGHGAVTEISTGLVPRLSIVESGAASWEWWRRAHPEITALPEVSRLWDGVRRCFDEAEPAFAALTTFSLVHGDAAVPNILVSGGVPRYVDWEWACIGDPARDLGYLGGPVWADPWYLPLEPGRVDLLLDAYVDAAGPPRDRETLAVRRLAWLVHETFFVTLHLRRQEDRDRYGRAIARIEEGLTDLLVR